MQGRILLAALTALACVCVVIPAAIAGKAPAPTTSPGLLPDLQTTVPAHLNLVNQQQQTLLRFSNGVANTGKGHLALRPENVGDITNGIQEIYDADGNIVEERLASQYAFHPAHNHWHLGDVALFEVRSGSPTGPIVSGNSIKVTFCLIDWIAVDGNSNTSSRNFWDCETSMQGISAGWIDQYHHALEGQQLNLTTAPNNKDLYLVSTANFAGKFKETDTTNNTAWIRFRLSQDSNGNRKLTVTGNSPCSGERMCGRDLPNR